MSATSDPMQFPRYAGPATLLRARAAAEPEDADIAVFGVPFDGATEARPGARLGPREMRNQSSMVRPVHPVTRANPYELCRVRDLGDVPFRDPFDVATSHQDIERFAARIVAAGATPLAAGGDHSITLPILRALAARWGPLGLFHVDAHTDTWNEELGSTLTHGTPFRRAVEERLIDPRRAIQIGIRGAAGSDEAWAFSERAGMRVVFVEEVAERGVAPIVAEARTLLGEKPAYLTFDVDGLDPCFAPGTGTPEIGGLTTREAQALVRGCRGLRLVGGDVVEVSPPFDPSGVTALVGATMMYEILCLLAEGRAATGE